MCLLLQYLVNWTAEVAHAGSKLLCGFFSAGMFGLPFQNPQVSALSLRLLKNLNGVPPEFGRSYGEKGILSWALGVAFEQI